MFVITVDILESHKACTQGIEDFTRLFGESLEIDSKEKAVRLALKFCPTLDVYFLATLIEDKRSYEESIEHLWKAYQEATDPLWEAYEEARAPNRRAYGEARAPHWQAYERAKAKLIAEMLWDQSQQEI